MNLKRLSFYIIWLTSNRFSKIAHRKFIGDFLSLSLAFPRLLTSFFISIISCYDKNYLFVCFGYVMEIIPYFLLFLPSVLDIFSFLPGRMFGITWSNDCLSLSIKPKLTHSVCLQLLTNENKLLEH